MRRTIVSSLFLSLLLFSDLSAQQAFEEEIVHFEDSDDKSPPAYGGILFTGSSSIRFWKTMAEDFEGRNVLNRGFGGSQFSDLLHFYDRVIIPYRPSKILVYEGDNDIASGKTPERVLSDFKQLVQKLQKDLPDCEIAFISIKPSPSRWNVSGEMKEANALIKSYCQSNQLTYIDVFNPMLRDGRPIPEYYLSDSLHMTPAGYHVWVEEVRPFVE
jgi:lysophospholipase L1-like esterase